MEEENRFPDPEEIFTPQELKEIQDAFDVMDFRSEEEVKEQEK